MKVVTQKGDLVESLAIANRAVSTRSSIQVLSGVLLQAREGEISLAASDMEIFVKAPLRGRVDEPGSLVLPARILTDICKNLPNQEVTIEQRSGEGQAEIRAGESLFVLHALAAQDFPQIPVLPQEKGFEVDRSAFLSTVDRVAPAASRDETRPVLTGVLINVTKEIVRMVATDSYRLSVKETALSASVPGRVEAIVPARSLTELSRIAGGAGDEKLTVLPTENQVGFEIGGVSLTSRLIDGQFPNYKQLIPETFEYTVSLDRGEFLEVVRRIGLMAQRNAPLRLKFGDSTLTVSAESQDVGRARESFPVQYTGDEIEIGFNPEFLEAGLVAAEGESVDMNFISPLRPALLKAESGDFLYLIMPIRLSE